MAKGTVAAMSCDPATSGFQMTESYADVAPSGYTYDAAGDVTYDGVNNYAYDGEGRLCAMQYVTGIGSPGPIVGYIYDAEGTRVAKGTLTSWSCNPATNGFTATASNVLGLGGEQVTEMTVTGNPTSGYSSTWNHTNVFGGGKLVASYYGTDTYFAFTDWLGTKRAEYTPDGTSALYSSLPYGDGLSSSGSAADATEHHFTGKERDIESGNDYFEARYYSSAMGRFMSPDWAAVPMPVPYASLFDPQSLNLYSYVHNNPLSGVDADGHASCKDVPALCRAILDAFSRGGSIVDGWANYLGQTAEKLANGVESAKKDLDTFNSVLGFGKTNCAGGGSCSDALSQATGAVIAAVASDGESEAGAVEGMIARSEGKIANIIEDHLSPKDLSAAEREANGGMRVAGPNGKLWDHVEEVSQAINGLERQVRHLERMLSRSGLSEEQAGRINNLLEKGRGALNVARKAITPSN